MDKSEQSVVLVSERVGCVVVFLSVARLELGWARMSRALPNLLGWSALL